MDANGGDDMNTVEYFYPFRKYELKMFDPIPSLSKFKIKIFKTGLAFSIHFYFWFIPIHRLDTDEWSIVW